MLLHMLDHIIFASSPLDHILDRILNHVRDHTCDEIVQQNGHHHRERRRSSNYRGTVRRSRYLANTEEKTHGRRRWAFSMYNSGSPMCN